MSVELETARVAYSGSGTTGPFSIPFYFLANSHIKAVKLASGTETTLTLTTDYTLTGAEDQDGGTLTLVVALATGETLTITRNVPLTQETEWPIADPFPAESHEQAADKLTMIVQQQGDTLGRTLRQPTSDTNAIAELPIASVRANQALTFDADGDPLMATLSAVSFTPTTEAFDGDGSETDFALSAPPSVASALIVRIDGVVQTAITDYTVSGSTLTFTTAPASGTGNVVVQNFGVAAVVDTVGVDNVTGLSASTGASKVGFVQSGSGAIAEPTQTALRRILFLGQYDTTANYRTSRDALTGTTGLQNLELTGSLAVGVTGATEAVSGYGVSVHGAAARILAKSTASTGSAGLSIFHTGSREYLLKTDTNDGSKLRLGHGGGDGSITTNWLLLDGTTTRVYFGAIEALHISGTASTETVYRTQADPTNKVISFEWFRSVDDITNPANYERLQLITDQITANTFTLRTEAAGTGTLRDLEIRRGAVLHMSFGATSTQLGAIVKLGTPSETNAVAGDLVLANANELRGANAANSGNFHLIGMNASDQIQVGHSGVALIAPQLAGTGTRNVVVDANGVLSAP